MSGAHAQRGPGHGCVLHAATAHASQSLRPACPPFPPPTHRYHNRVHATDVLQWTHMLMRRGRVLSTLQVRVGLRVWAPGALRTARAVCMRAAHQPAACRYVRSCSARAARCAAPPQVCDAGTLAALLSAVVHDVGHKGLNNDFLIRSGDELAVRARARRAGGAHKRLHVQATCTRAPPPFPPPQLLYNDASPMENHHLAATFQLLAQDQYNFLARAPVRVGAGLRGVCGSAQQWRVRLCGAGRAGRAHAPPRCCRRRARSSASR